MKEEHNSLDCYGKCDICSNTFEIKNPNKNLPLAMILSLLFITAIYVLTAFVLVGNIPSDSLTADLKPIHTISELLGGKYFGWHI